MKDKSEQKKVVITNNLLSQKYKTNRLQLKAKIVENWTIQPEERCNICWVNIKVGEEFTRCISCNNKFHAEHWRQWIIAKQSCPICKIKI